MMRPRDTVVVIFGGAGDLATTKLLPALFRLWTEGALPDRWEIVGTGRTRRSDREYRELAADGIVAATGDMPPAPFLDRLTYVSTTFAPGSTDVLRAAVDAAGARVGSDPAALVYVSTPPGAYHDIAAAIVESDLLGQNGRVVFEKPFGRDRADAASLARTLRDACDDDQVFLIDHFLGKEAVQGLLSIRFANELFDAVWNRHHIDHVQINVLEDGDVGERAGFFEQTGTIRDMLMTHMFHVMAFAAMDPPTSISPGAVTTEVEKVFERIRPVTGRDVVRGQYSGYLETDGVAADSDVETFVAARVLIDNHRWSGVPWILRTGKALGEKRSAVTVVFRAPPRGMFPGGDGDPPLDPNRLTVDLDRAGCLSLGLMTKDAGWDLTLEPRRLELTGPDSSDRVGAYERLLYDALHGDRTLFTSITALDRAWQAVASVLEAPPPVNAYAPGSAGPAEADRLVAPYDWAISAPHATSVARAG